MFTGEQPVRVTSPGMPDATDVVSYFLRARFVAHSVETRVSLPLRPLLPEDQSSSWIYFRFKFSYSALTTCMWSLQDMLKFLAFLNVRNLKKKPLAETRLIALEEITNVPLHRSYGILTKIYKRILYFFILVKTFYFLSIN